MAEEKNVLVPILIGCGLFGLLCFLVCGGGLVFFVPRAMQQAERAGDQAAAAGLAERSRELWQRLQNKR